MRAALFLPILIGLAAPAVAAPDAAQWLETMAQAERTQAFEGTFVYERDGDFSTYQIWHRVGDGAVQDRVLKLDGVASERVQSDGRTVCMTGRSLVGIAQLSHGAIASVDPLKLMSWYELRVAGASRVAGRDAVVVTLVPRDRDRYAFEMHLDSHTGLLLKSLLIDAKGRLLERLQYTRLQPGAPVLADLKSTANCKPVLHADSGSVPASLLAWRARWVPAGFELAHTGMRRSSVSSANVISLLYADGLAHFSVFLEPLNGAAARDTRVQLGPTAAVSRRLKTSDGELMITVVGEIPLGTAERIALSMQRQDVHAVR
ncbi:RNA polymerase sigma-H factor AlgU [Pseudomonas rhizosphaerae]|uniref:RNA polymerase sigma-H factor AlgU n=1 Tax=Pseudomonas rhizosphaerae TaxID=216142 RepID=A0A089YQS3_9PSED|nr:MucB/RseB C-terminal domain-containing protein [Pseudomonas rhizosphaerae]AIS16742.1 RNA polymerase sigma-H factor AlgU [Pseudomonas rhizosphaerae]